MPIIDSDNLINRFCSECEYEDDCRDEGISEDCEIVRIINAEIEAELAAEFEED
jgi:hypothetical protein